MFSKLLNLLIFYIFIGDNLILVVLPIFNNY